MMKRCVLLVPVLLVSVCVASEPRLDGLFDEWDAAHLIATDPAGDATGAFDIRHVWAMNRGSRLFLRFDTGSTLNIQSGNASDGTVRVELGLPAGQALTIDTRARSIWRNNNPNLAVSWATVGYAIAPTYASDEFEMSVDLSPYGVVQGSAITVQFSGSDSLASPAPFVMSEPAVAPARRSWERSEGSFRLASMNTENTGLLHSTRRARLLRLVDAVDADIYCFQEEYNSTAAQVHSAVESVDPLEDGAPWFVHKNNDNAIVSRWPLLPIPSGSSSYAGAVAVMPEGRAVAVFCVHYKCCGFIGSSEDAQRISQKTAMLASLESLRSGALGPAYEAYRDAPVVVIGDWNLVGSRTPLGMVEDPPGPQLRDAMPANLIGEDVMTWRGRSTGAGSFAPGRLDLIAYSGAGLSLTGAFLLDSRVLNAAELSALGILSTDSDATDHLVSVADLAFAAAPPPPCIGDANGDREVNFADVSSVLVHWGLTHPGPFGPGDADGDGAVTFADIVCVLENWLSDCGG